MNPPKPLRAFRAHEVYELEHHGAVVQIPVKNLSQKIDEGMTACWKCTCGSELDIRWHEAANA